jgi:hypothetical protein
MPLRVFHDTSGIEWTVWNTAPPVGTGHVMALDRFLEKRPAEDGVKPARVRNDFRHGWLTFQSYEEKRRLAPVPDGWESQSEAQLCELLAQSRLSKRLE